MPKVVCKDGNLLRLSNSRHPPPSFEINMSLVVTHKTIRFKNILVVV